MHGDMLTVVGAFFPRALTPFGWCPVDRKYFCRICSCFPTGVTVATLIGADGQPHGITVSSFTSVSLDPALVLICIDHRSQMLRYLDPGRAFAINVLSSAQRE